MCCHIGVHKRDTSGRDQLLSGLEHLQMLLPDSHWQQHAPPAQKSFVKRRPHKPPGASTGHKQTWLGALLKRLSDAIASWAAGCLDCQHSNFSTSYGWSVLHHLTKYYLLQSRLFVLLQATVTAYTPT